MDFDVQQKLMPHLNSGERLLWSGRPRTGIAFQSGDTFAIPFSAVWFGLSLFALWGGLTSDGPRAPLLFLVPFVLFGAYIFAGRFFHDSWKRSHTYYGLTPERVIIVSGMSARTIQSVSLRTLQDISVKTKEDGSGTIILGPKPSYGSWVAETSWPGGQWKASPRLRMVPDAQNVYSQIMRAQQEIRA